ncbi:DUF2971 domain-containing protein [Bradyrhizobium erythrophlei]|uniref:DUF2971 domain-containing protein n=1 Tax=Bradyrhizobium erythrophlei TaxID=1437360 RepID=A0A1M5S1J5_9BRAD|nr:DUF2971 domain-containing protein [Bradyrhizobium erythrophlei]SHH32198.1 Protein of unknown function [Bradyrhizobium erythrophlei]
MNTNEPYITDADKAHYRSFAMHHLPSVGREPVTEVWHYTTAQGLIAILNDGKMYSTQISCLNDSLEQRYFGDLVHAGVKKLITTNNEQAVGILLQAADNLLSNRDFAALGHFVICFSEVEDDLGQWRGYGGGQCGYAIGFDYLKLFSALPSIRADALLAPMNYDLARQTFVVDDLLRNAQLFFTAGLSGRDVQRWANEFLAAFSGEMDIFACITKHPAFAAEKERRIITRLNNGETNLLEFRQKQTLLARHLPIDLRVSAGLLPITRICVGPGPAQRVSQVSVGDLLIKAGYSDIPVTLSTVPFRIP